MPGKRRPADRVPQRRYGRHYREVTAGTRTPIVVGQPLGNSDVNVGFVYCAGIDAKLTERVIARFEYLRTDLGDTVYFIPSQGQTGTVPVTAMNLYRGALILRF